MGVSVPQSSETSPQQTGDVSEPDRTGEHVPAPKQARLHFFTTMTAQRFLLALAGPVVCIAVLTFLMGTHGKDTSAYQELRDWRDFSLALGAAAAAVAWQARVRYVQKVEGWCTELVKCQMQLMRVFARPVGSPDTWKPDGVLYQDALVTWSCLSLGLQGLGIVFSMASYKEVWESVGDLSLAFKLKKGPTLRDMQLLAKDTAWRMMELAEDVRR